MSCLKSQSRQHPARLRLQRGLGLALGLVLDLVLLPSKSIVFLQHSVFVLASKLMLAVLKDKDISR